MGNRELIALLSLSSWCRVMVVWLFLAVPWVYLQFVIVVFPDLNKAHMGLGTRKHLQGFESCNMVQNPEDRFS